MTLWILIRAAGIGAYVALFLSVVWGLVSTTSVVTRRVTKPAGNQFHAVIGATGLVLLALHVVLLVFHEYIPFDVNDVLVPMRATYRPVAVALGIVSMYAAVIVVVSSWIRKWLPTRWWRDLHLLATPVFILALLHGVFAGTDTDRPVMVALYVGSALVVLFLLFVRGLTFGFRPPRREPPAGARSTRAVATDAADANVG